LNDPAAPSGLRARCSSRALVCAVVLVAISAAGVAQTSAGRSLTNSIGLSAPSEPYSELYFVEPRAFAELTEKPHLGAVHTTVVFAVRNREHRTVSYAWTLAVGSRNAAAGTLVARPGASGVVEQEVTVTCKTRRQTAAGSASTAQVPVTVTLARPREAIDYLVDCDE